MQENETGTVRGFVGRAAELDVLTRALSAAQEGESGFVLFAGDGGLGKTRLLEEFARRSGLPHERVLWGRCPEQSGAPSLWPWSQALGGFVEGLGDDELRARLGSAAADVAQVAPIVGERLGLEASRAGDGDDNRFRIFGGIAAFLARASDREPLAMLFDDLHFADRASLALLEFVVQELRGARVLLVGAYRPREMRQASDAASLLSRATEHVALAGLQKDEIADFIRVRSRVAPTDAVVSHLQETSEGHPFFLDELVRALKASGELSSDRAPEVRGRLPERVRAAIRRRLTPLSPIERETLELAAVIGRSFDLATLALVFEAPAVDILERLSAPIASGIVEEEPDAPGGFRFAHALLREALYGDLLPAARTAAHRRVALALERRSADDAEPPLAELAHHFYFSAPLGDAPKAVDYSARAALRALSLGAHEESVAHYERALQALALQPPDERRRLELRLALGSTLWRAGNEREARETFRRAADSARTVGDPVALARAVMGFNSTSALTGTVDEAALRMLEEALATVGEKDSPLRSHLLSYTSMRLYFAPDRERARALASEALATAERIGDRGSQSTALLASHFANWDPDGLATRQEIAPRIVAVAGQAGWPMVALEGRMWCIVDALESGDLSTVDIELDALERQAQAAGIARWVAQACFLRAMRALLAARFGDAERFRARALQIRPAEDRNNAAQFHLVQRFAAYRDQGRLAEIQEEVEALVDRHPALPIWRAGLALLRAELGQGREARKILEVLTARGLGHLRVDSNWLPTVALLAEVASLSGDAERADVLGKLLEPYAERTIVIGTGVGCYGSAERYVGLAAHAAGRLDEAERHLSAGLEANERLGAPALAARTRCDLAQVLAQRGSPGDADRAATLLAEARELAETHALRGLERHLARTVPSTTSSAVAPAESAVGAREATTGERGVATLRREGDYWTVAYDGTEFRLKHSKGLDYLVMLLREPGREFHVLDLAAGEGARDERASEAGAAQLLESGLQAGDLGDAGEILDPAARAAYRRRLEELREELEEARSFNDPERASRAEHELDFLADELARGVGLGGRSRKAASASERARQNLSRTIGGVLKKVAAECPTLGQYLIATVHTGAFCSYDPDPRAPITWRL